MLNPLYGQVSSYSSLYISLQSLFLSSLPFSLHFPLKRERAGVPSGQSCSQSVTELPSCVWRFPSERGNIRGRLAELQGGCHGRDQIIPTRALHGNGRSLLLPAAVFGGGLKTTAYFSDRRCDAVWCCTAGGGSQVMSLVSERRSLRGAAESGNADCDHDIRHKILMWWYGFTLWYSPLAHSCGFYKCCRAQWSWLLFL